MELLLFEKCSKINVHILRFQLKPYCFELMLRDAVLFFLLGVFWPVCGSPGRIVSGLTTNYEVTGSIPGTFAVSKMD